jgi:hypothetical protein
VYVSPQNVHNAEPSTIWHFIEKNLQALVLNGHPSPNTHSLTV